MPGVFSLANSNSLPVQKKHHEENFVFARTDRSDIGECLTVCLEVCRTSLPRANFLAYSPPIRAKFLRNAFLSFASWSRKWTALFSQQNVLQTAPLSPVNATKLHQSALERPPPPTLESFHRLCSRFLQSSREPFSLLGACLHC